MSTRTTDESTTHTFRAATLEEAVAIAEQTLGCRVTLVAANRIRRGGLGGFFAADLGVEVVVSPIEETVESALERLISSSSNEERARWEADHKDSTAAVAAALAAVVAGDSAPTESVGRSWLRRRSAAVDELASVDNSWYSPPASDLDRGNRPERLARLAELDRVFGVVTADGGAAAAQPEVPAPFVDHDPTGRLEIPAEVRDEVRAEVRDEVRDERVAPVSDALPRLPSGTPSPITAQTPTAGSSSLARVERIIEELQVLTSTPRLLAALGTSSEQRRAGGVGASAPTGRTASAEAGRPETGRAESPEWAPVGTRPAPGMVQRPSWPTTTRAEHSEPTPTVSLATPRAIHATATTAGTAATASQASAAPHTNTAAPAVAPAPAAASSELAQRQVELAVSAADALLGSLRREDGVKRLSVRVILRTGDHDEVAAEAEWDASE